MFKTAKLLNLVVVLIMLLDVVGAITVVHASSTQHPTFHAKSLKSSSIAKILFVKEAEEESEKSEEKRDKFIGGELIDFSRLAVALSNIHTPQFNFVPFQERFTVRPALFTMHCVFLI